jgi:hypothetical protein
VFAKLSVECCKILVKLGDLSVGTFDVDFGLFDVILHLFYGSHQRLDKSLKVLPYQAPIQQFDVPCAESLLLRLVSEDQPSAC